MPSYVLSGDVGSVGINVELSQPVDAYAIPYDVIVDGTTVRLGSVKVPISAIDGTFSVTLAAGYYTFRVRYLDPASGDRKQLETAVFNLDAAKTLAAIVNSMAANPPTITTLQTAVDAAAASATAAAASAAQASTISGLTGEDGAVAALVNDAASSTRSALSTALVSTYVGGSVAQTATGPNTIIKGHASNAMAADIERSVILGSGTSAYNNVIGGDGVNVDTVTPNTVTLGTGAHVSVVGGYDNSAGALSSKIISDHSKTVPGSQGHNAIFGGAGHIHGAASGFSFIGGGLDNTVNNLYAFATGKAQNVTGQGGFAAGTDHVVSANFGSALGTTCSVLGIGAFARGSSCAANANYSEASGNFSVARSVGQHAHTGGRFAVSGDAQTSVVEMHKATIDATTTTLGVLGSGTSYLLQPNQSVIVKVMLVARVVGGTDTAAWEIAACYRRGATGVPIAVGTPTVTLVGADAGAATWTAAITADSAGGLNVRITGEAAKTIRWVQRMTLAEVTV